MELFLGFLFCRFMCLFLYQYHADIVTVALWCEVFAFQMAIQSVPLLHFVQISRFSTKLLQCGAFVKNQSSKYCGLMSGLWSVPLTRLSILMLHPMVSLLKLASRGCGCHFWTNHFPVQATSPLSDSVSEPWHQLEPRRKGTIIWQNVGKLWPCLLLIRLVQLLPSREWHLLF